MGHDASAFTCDACASGTAPLHCAACDARRCEQHLLLDVRAATVGHTYVATQMVPGPVVHVTPQGQPIHSPQFVPVQVPVKTEVPVLSATNHAGSVVNYPIPESGPAVRPWSDAARASAIEQWTVAKRACVWCREQSGRLAAAAVTAQEDARRAEIERRNAERRAARDAEEAEEAAFLEARHDEEVHTRRRRFGPEQDLRRRIDQLKVIEAQAPGYRVPGRIERFAEATSLGWLAAIFFAPFISFWALTDHAAVGAVAMVIVWGPAATAAVVNSRRERSLRVAADRARSERTTLESHLGCGPLCPLHDPKSRDAALRRRRTAQRVADRPSAPLS